MKWLGAGCLALVGLLCAAMVVDLVAGGFGELSLDFAVAAARDSGRAGGIGAVVLSTVLVAVLAISIAAPLALAAAVLCAEGLRRRPRAARCLRGGFEVMVSVPSVAIGLVGWTLFGRGLGLGFSLLGGALTLALMLAPVMTVAFTAGLERVPTALRRASLALGVSRWDTLWRQVVPAARPALLAGVALALGRATAETAALVLTSGVSLRVPGSILDPGATLAVHVYNMARNVPGGEPRAYSAALVLLAINVAVFATISRLQHGVR